MTEKKKVGSERSESSGSTPGKEKEPTLGGPEGSALGEPRTNKVLGEAEEGAAEAVPTPEVEVPAEKRVELTEKELAELKKRAEERDEYLDILLHTKADFSNYQKRMKRELESMGRYATQELVKALIPAMDHLSRAIKSAGISTAGEKRNDADNLKKFLDGLQLIQNEFLKALEVAGVKNVEVIVGQPFNPEFHEAFLEEENTQLPHHTILEMLEPGFTLHDRVLKPSKVKVSKKPAPPVEKHSQEALPAEGEVPSELKSDSPQANQEDIKGNKGKKA